MWAEAATNYFDRARHLGFFHNLLALDSGYFSVPQRLLAWFIALLPVRPSLVPYFYDVFQMTLSFLLVFAFCHPCFRSLVGCDLLRMLFSFFILLVADFES